MEAQLAKRRHWAGKGKEVGYGTKFGFLNLSAMQKC